ncbi:MAG: hypothetical protein V9F00_04735 [Nocardioides sp.]
MALNDMEKQSPAPALPPALARWAGPPLGTQREITVGGRTQVLEVAIVAAVHAVAALWLLIALKDVWVFIPDLVRALFADEFSFVFAWVLLIVVLVLLYVVGLLAYCAYLLFKGEPVGRGLAAVLCLTLTMLQFTQARSTSLTLIWLVSAACVAVLFLSPWARRILDRPVGFAGRPPSIVLSQTLAVSYLSLVAAMVVALLPGLRFAGDAGAGFVAFELFGGAAAATGLLAARRLSAEADRTARVLLSISIAVPAVFNLISGSGAGVATGLGIAAGVVVPLWALPDARRWFGDTGAAG